MPRSWKNMGLKDPEDMARRSDDFSGIHGVRAFPERLRNRALRKLWLTNPVLANLDDLVEYGEDYTDAATVVENLADRLSHRQGLPAGRRRLRTPRRM